jgi:LPPG:FO 2-phospho-L-lactate transferase
LITTLAGGVGAARFLQGLVNVVPEKDITVIVNTGDDIDLHGLHISPDIDIVMYTLAGIVDEEKGWGIQGDTFHCLELLDKYGFETWFNLGDKDLATHLYRTHLLTKGVTISEVTTKICKKLGLQLSILPMTDQKVETKVVTNNKTIHFQEYLVKRKAQDEVANVFFEGIEKAKPAVGVVDSILSADQIIICPSNPIVSIGTILSIKGIKNALEETEAKVVAISPIVAGSPIKGPADKLMRGLGFEVSAYAVAKLYRSFLDTFIIDHADKVEKERIESLGIQVTVTNTIMTRLSDKIQLAKVALGSVEVA